MTISIDRDGLIAECDEDNNTLDLSTDPCEG